MVSDRMWPDRPGVTTPDHMWPDPDGPGGPHLTTQMDLPDMTRCEQKLPDMTDVTIWDQMWQDITRHVQIRQVWPDVIITKHDHMWPDVKDRCDQTWPDVTRHNHMWPETEQVWNSRARKSIQPIPLVFQWCGVEKRIFPNKHKSDKITCGNAGIVQGDKSGLRENFLLWFEYSDISLLLLGQQLIRLNWLG